MDEHALAERLMAYDTSKPDRLHAAAEFVKGWLEVRDVAVRHVDHGGLPVILADAGGGEGPLVVFHGHLDVVPAFEEVLARTRGRDCFLNRHSFARAGFANLKIFLRNCRGRHKFKGLS